jgi:hypothetical protein
MSEKANNNRAQANTASSTSNQSNWFVSTSPFVCCSRIIRDLPIVVDIRRAPRGLGGSSLSGLRHALLGGVATPLNRCAVELAYHRKATSRKLDLNPSINFLFQNAFAKQLHQTRKEKASLYQLRTSGHETLKTKRATGQGFKQNY